MEATKYTDVMQTKKKRRSIRGAKLHQMAFANLGRSKKKTELVVVSLALSVTLFNEMCIRDRPKAQLRFGICPRRHCP